jgi:hypothetical protein
VAVIKLVKNSELGSYMNYNGIEANKLNPVLPAVNEIQLASIPTLTANVTNRNEFVKSSLSENWFIDYAGDGLNLGHKNGIYYFNALSSNFPTVAQVNTTRVNIPSWSFNVVAGKSYKIEIISSFTAAALTTGGSMGLITSGGAVGTIHGYFSADISAAAVATGLRSPLVAINTVNTTANSFMTSSGVSSTTIPHTFDCTAVFNCTTGGTVTIQWGSEVALSLASLLQGSSLIVKLLN